MAAKKAKAKKPKAQEKPEDSQIWKKEFDGGEFTLDIVWMNAHYPMLFLRNITYGAVGSDNGFYIDPSIAEELIGALDHALEHAYSDALPQDEENEEENKESIPELPSGGNKKMTN